MRDKLLPPHKLLKAILYGVLALIAATAVVVTYWNVQSSDVIVAKNAPYPVRVVQTPQGNIAVATLDYCKLLNKDGTVVIRFVGKKSITMSGKFPERQKKGCQKAQFPILLPPQLTDDTFYIEFSSVYQINPITVVTETSRSQSFTIR